MGVVENIHPLTQLSCVSFSALTKYEDIFVSSKRNFGHCSKAAAGCSWKGTRCKESMVDLHCGHTLM